MLYLKPSRWRRSSPSICLTAHGALSTIPPPRIARSCTPSITGKVGAPDAVDESQISNTIDAAGAGFDASVLPGTTLLKTVPPREAVLAFGSELAAAFKGREIMYNFGGEAGWPRGMILTPATNGAIKHTRRVCNFRDFYEADDGLLN